MYRLYMITNIDFLRKFLQALVTIIVLHHFHMDMDEMSQKCCICTEGFAAHVTAHPIRPMLQNVALDAGLCRVCFQAFVTVEVFWVFHVRTIIMPQQSILVFARFVTLRAAHC